jgi:hypothetical protein
MRTMRFSNFAQATCEGFSSALLLLMLVRRSVAEKGAHVGAE